MKQCPECHQEFGDDHAFCTACGVALVAQREPTGAPRGKAAHIGLGDKNVVAGDIIGRREEIRVSGDATIVKHEDQTRQVKECRVCGKVALMLDGYTCQQCGEFVCQEHFDKKRLKCSQCLKESVVESEGRYRDLLLEALADSVIGPDDRQLLERERERLGISESRARTLESETRRRGHAEIELSTRDRRLLSEGERLLLEEFDDAGALEVLRSLYPRYPSHATIRDLYLMVLVERDAGTCLKLIEGMHFDDRTKSLAHIEILARQGEFDLAYEVLKDAHRVFGRDDPVFLARDIDLCLDEYVRTNEASCLRDARELGKKLDDESVDAYITSVRAYLRFVCGKTDAFRRAEEELREAGLSTFYVERKKRFLGLNPEQPPPQRPAFCGNCGAPAIPDAAFCGECGGRLSPAP